MKNILIIVSLLCFLANILPVFAGEEKKQLAYSEPPKKELFILQKIENIQTFFSFQKLKTFFSPQHIKEMGPDFWIPFGISILLAPLLLTYVFIPFLSGLTIAAIAASAGKMVIMILVSLAFAINQFIVTKKVAEMTPAERKSLNEEIADTKQEYRNLQAQQSKADVQQNQRINQRLSENIAREQELKRQSRELEKRFLRW